MNGSVAGRAQARRAWEPLAAMLVGLLAFLSVRGGSIVRPGHTAWLMEGDPVSHWLGWQFFRQSPFWQWPLGANPGYGLDLGSSVVFSDSIPLFALLFKALSAWLPADFQYMGLWLLLCFCLQGLYAWKLLCLLGIERRLALLGSAFFVVAPSFLFRMLHGHYALTAHWLVLAGLCLYFSPRLRIGWWSLLLVLAALVHAYLLVMVWAIWSADLVQRRLLRQQRAGPLLAACGAGNALVACAMALAGYFMLGARVENWGFGVYRLNLLALIDPDALWSRLLRNQPSGEGDYEGFGYLGVGVLLLAVVALADCLRGGRVRLRPGLWPLWVAVLGMTVFAVSPSVAFGAHELLRYRWPSGTDTLTGAFRASGRMVWPAYYLIIVGVLCLLFARLPRRVAAALCALLLVAQLADMADGRRALHARMGLAGWSSPLVSPAWTDFARRYDKVLLVQPRNVAPHWLPLGQFAAAHGMAINTGYLARVDPQTEAAYAARMAKVVEDNAFAPDALYVFEGDALWHQALAHLKPGDAAGLVDGLRVLAPGMRGCTACAVLSGR